MHSAVSKTGAVQCSECRQAGRWTSAGNLWLLPSSLPPTLPLSLLQPTLAPLLQSTSVASCVLERFRRASDSWLQCLPDLSLPTIGRRGRTEARRRSNRYPTWTWQHKPELPTYLTLHTYMTPHTTTPTPHRHSPPLLCTLLSPHHTPAF